MGNLLYLYNEIVCLYSLKQDFTDSRPLPERNTVSQETGNVP